MHELASEAFKCIISQMLQIRLFGQLTIPHFTIEMGQQISPDDSLVDKKDPIL